LYFIPEWTRASDKSFTPQCMETAPSHCGHSGVPPVANVLGAKQQANFGQDWVLSSCKDIFGLVESVGWARSLNCPLLVGGLLIGNGNVASLLQTWIRRSHFYVHLFVLFFRTLLGPLNECSSTRGGCACAPFPPQNFERPQSNLLVACTFVRLPLTQRSSETDPSTASITFSITL